ncbi:MAG: endolytic transglycosylase MltG [Pseudomonadota bacterium]
MRADVSLTTKPERQAARLRRQAGGIVGALVGLLAFAGFLAGAAAYFGWREASRPGPLADEKIVMIEQGASVGAMADQLQREGAIRSALVFKAAARARRQDGALKAGEYEIPIGASTLDVLDLLVSGKSVLHTLTIPEGLTTAQILRLAASAPKLTGEISLEPAEGALLPETYAFTRGESRDAIVSRMADAQTELLDALWEGRATELPYTTRREAIILASIVEKETGAADERRRVAAVFVNRLKRGMRLESDPTIIYGLTGGEPLGRGIRESELRKETPYNTYRVAGLPPTPIANPGREAIEAVLDPMQTEELFFVADGNGGHAFAETLQEHNANVAKWRRIERERQP